LLFSRIQLARTQKNSFGHILFRCVFNDPTRLVPPLGRKHCRVVGAGVDNSTSAQQQQQESRSAAFFSPADGQVIIRSSSFVFQLILLFTLHKPLVVGLYFLIFTPAGVLPFNRTSYTAHILVMARRHSLELCESYKGKPLLRLMFFFLSLSFKWQ